MNSHRVADNLELSLKLVFTCLVFLFRFLLGCQKGCPVSSNTFSAKTLHLVQLLKVESSVLMGGGVKVLPGTWLVHHPAIKATAHPKQREPRKKNCNKFYANYRIAHKNVLIFILFLQRVIPHAGPHVGNFLGPP